MVEVPLYLKTLNWEHMQFFVFTTGNNNGKMDFKDNGMPMEDYGVSNNVMSFALPSYHGRMEFDLGDKDLLLEIKF